MQCEGFDPLHHPRFRGDQRGVTLYAAHSRVSGNPVYHPHLGPRFRGDERRGIPLMPKTPDYFVGKTIIITGAASGIGRAAALIFAREGANVVCTDINADAAKQTAERIVAQGGKALALRTDVTSRKDVNDMIRRAIDTFGAVQFLFNSAGAALRRSKFLDIDDALFDNAFSLNVKGTFYCMQAILPHMLQNGHGVIV